LSSVNPIITKTPPSLHEMHVGIALSLLYTKYYSNDVDDSFLSPINLTIFYLLRSHNLAAPLSEIEYKLPE
jgi:hypothetical protein